MRRTRVLKEGIVTKQEEVEVSTPSLEEAPIHTEEVEGKIIQLPLTAESREGMKKRAIATQDAPGFGLSLFGAMRVQRWEAKIRLPLP